MSRILINGKTVLAEQVIVAESASERMRGLLGRSSLPADTAMLIHRCRSIHTWFMRFAIDVIFLDREMRVLRVSENIRPWRMAFGPRKAVAVLETAAARLGVPAVQPGDFLTLE
ncbi:MAG: DUF192 domain-containing protein [Kiritimatiellales bacterium]|nr:DUF192 domain-containing protein [Kiritimatiellales bacterium]